MFPHSRQPDIFDWQAVARATGLAQRRIAATPPGWWATVVIRGLSDDPNVCPSSPTHAHQLARDNTHCRYCREVVSHV